MGSLFLSRRTPGLLQLRVHRTYTLRARSSLSSDRRASSAANCDSVSASSCRMAATSSSRSVMPTLFKGNDQRVASERCGLPLSGIHVHVHAMWRVRCSREQRAALSKCVASGRWKAASAAPVRGGFSTMLPCPAAAAAHAPWVCTSRVAGGEPLCAPIQVPEPLCAPIQVPLRWGRGPCSGGVRGAEAPFPPRLSQSWAWEALPYSGGASMAVVARTPCEAAGRAAGRPRGESW